MAIYTRTGDAGTTGLFSGQKVSKDSLIIDFAGSLDELNSILGVCTSSLAEVEKVDFTPECEVVEDIQRDMFVVGALASGANMSFNPVLEVKNIEKTIDDYEKLIPPLKFFILPGGSMPAAHLHYARTLVRKVERQAIGLKSKSLSAFLPYLNRLSDLLFVMARYVNKKMKVEEVVWKGR